MNVILLPKANFAVHTSADEASHQIAHITDPNSIAHVYKVLRLGINDTLKIGQLGGNLGVARIANMTSTAITLDKVTLTQPPPPKLGISVILALPRPKVLRRLIMDMTALGVDDIILVNSCRTQKSYWQSPLLERVPEFVQEGLQQAVDTIVPNVYFKKRLRPFVEDELALILASMLAKTKGQAGKLLFMGNCSQTVNHHIATSTFYPTAIIAHPYSPNQLSTLLSATSHQTNRHNQACLPRLLAIGAEGGWIDFEIELFKRQGFVAMRHGQRILRTEAAVNVMLGSFIR